MGREGAVGVGSEPEKQESIATWGIGVNDKRLAQ